MNFTQSVMTINDSNKNLVYACDNNENLEWFEKSSYWTEGVFQLGLGMYLIIKGLVFLV